MKSIQILALAAALLSTGGASPAPIALERRQDPDDLLIFLCDDLPDICTNMCYGAYCQNIGESLTYDKPDAPTKRNRRHSAGCIASGGNRCSVRKGFQAGFQCDEYPFASSVPNGGANTRLNRCVPADQNRRQGGIINAFYRNTAYCNGGPCDFNVEFSNAGDIDVCTPGNTDACTAEDGNEEIGPGGNAQDGDEADDGTDDDGGNPEPTAAKKLKARGPEPTAGALAKPKNVRFRYRTSSGLEVDLTRRAVVGQRAVTVHARNATLFEEQVASHEFDPDDADGEYDYMLPNLEVRDDTIVAEIS